MPSASAFTSTAIVASAGALAFVVSRWMAAARDRQTAGPRTPSGRPLEIGPERARQAAVLLDEDAHRQGIHLRREVVEESYACMCVHVQEGMRIVHAGHAACDIALQDGGDAAS